MTRHMKASIEGLLALGNAALGKLTEMNGKEARVELVRRKMAGEKYIPTGDCDGFDPVHGCPGHPMVNGVQITITKGLIFHCLYKPHYLCEVKDINTGGNTLLIKLSSGHGVDVHYWTEEWSLEQTQWAFEKGEYFIEKEVKG